MSLPALPVSADTRSITERVNVLIRDYNTMLRVPAVPGFANGPPISSPSSRIGRVRWDA